MTRMVRTRLGALLALAMAATAVASCDASLTGIQLLKPTKIWVAPQKVACTGEGITECLLVRTGPAGEWQYFYGAIEGFTFEPGFLHQLEVETIRDPDPAMDGSAILYRLVRVISKEVPAISF